jgi:hypothetical protein
MVWLSIEITVYFYIENLLYITAEIHGMRQVGLIVVSQPIN